MTKKSMFLKGERPCLEANQALDSFKGANFFYIIVSGYG